MLVKVQYQAQTSTNVFSLWLTKEKTIKPYKQTHTQAEIIK